MEQTNLDRNLKMQNNMERLESLITQLFESEENNVRYQSIVNFYHYILDNTNFTSAPASDKYHLNCEGGLLEHSVNVAEKAVSLYHTLCTDQTPLGSVILCSLFHDLGKIGMPDNPYYIDGIPTPKQKKFGYPASYPYSHNPNLTHLDHEIRSLYLISRFIPLTEQEQQAIVMHNGQYVDGNRFYKMRECQLSLIVHWADLWCARFIEPTHI
jgi:hypothetical protein